MLSSFETLYLMYSITVYKIVAANKIVAVHLNFFKGGLYRHFFKPKSQHKK